MLIFLKEMIPRPFKRATKRILRNVCESFTYRLTRERPVNGQVRHVVFVCKGNICRSAFAEFYLRSLVPEGVVKIESCGLDVVQGIISPLEAVNVGREFGLELGVHQSKGLASCRIKEADLIVPMEYWQFLRLSAMYPDCMGKIRLLNDYAPWPFQLMCNIYDPFGLDEGEFRSCFRRMKRALDRLYTYPVIPGGEGK